MTTLLINELLNIKVSQLRTLTTESWIGINRSKDSPRNDKLSFRKEAKKIVQDRKKDCEFIFLLKDPDYSVFTLKVNYQ